MRTKDNAEVLLNGGYMHDKKKAMDENKIRIISHLDRLDKIEEKIHPSLEERRARHVLKEPLRDMFSKEELYWSKGHGYGDLHKEIEKHVISNG